MPIPIYMKVSCVPVSVHVCVCVCVCVHVHTALDICVSMLFEQLPIDSQGKAFMPQ